MSISELDLPVEHGTTDHKTTRPRCPSPCLETLRAVLIRTVHSQIKSLLSWPVLDTNAQTEQHMALLYIAHLVACGEGSGFLHCDFALCFDQLLENLVS